MPSKITIAEAREIARGIQDKAEADRKAYAEAEARRTQDEHGHWAVATGSLPVLSVQGLLEKWSALAGRLKDKSAEESHSLNTREAFRWESMQWMVEDCIKDLRAELARATERQPEENAEMTDANPKKGQSHER